jgi:hypothetical protein
MCTRTHQSSHAKAQASSPGAYGNKEIKVVIDRCNSTGFVAPMALVFLVALSRRRWRLLAVVVVLGALVKLQFAVPAAA